MVELTIFGNISKNDRLPPHPEILSSVTLIFVILAPLKDSFVVHLESDEFILFITSKILITRLIHKLSFTFILHIRSNQLIDHP